MPAENLKGSRSPKPTPFPTSHCTNRSASDDNTWSMIFPYRIPLFLALLFAPALPLLADPGHSALGEAFNEGPRQAAVLIPGTGDVHFPIKTAKPEAQKFFTQGIGQLHGFWYYEAERSFRQVAMLDPNCAMAYWGMAMANVNNEKRAKAFIKKAEPLKAKATAREQQWITMLETFYKEDKRDKKQRALDCIKDLETLVQDDPKDIEAKAFLVWKIWQASDAAPMSSSLAVDALLDQIFAIAPNHPANHYRIHLWDSANKPKFALQSAARCGQAAPGIAHMWHMSGHTYSKLRRFDDVAWQQEAATRVDHAYMMRDLVLPDQIHNYAHNEEWLTRTYNELGRANDAINLAESLITIPRHPSFNTLEKPSTSASYGRNRLLDTLLKWELWDRIIQESNGPLLNSVPQVSHQTARLRALGIAYYEKGDADHLTKTIASLEALEKTETAKAKAKEIKPAVQAAAAGKAAAATPPPPAGGKEAKNGTAGTAASKASATPPATTANAAAPAAPLSNPPAAGAIASSNAAKDAKTAAASPPPPKAPPVQASAAPKASPPSTAPATASTPNKKDDKKPAADPIPAALAELRALKAILTKDASAPKLLETAAKDLSKERLARLWLALGDKTKAEGLTKDFSQDLASLAVKTEVLTALGKTDDAKKAFEETRKVAFAMDPDLPIARRLAKLAATTYSITGEWRSTALKRDDVGIRPPLSSLGPVHWHPSPAPAWEALTLDGTPVKGATFTAGRPTILLFYLGSACNHCMKQINAFTKAASGFEKAGIQLAAITLEPMSLASRITEQMDTKKLPPFPIFCDPGLTAFKAFRAYDDFESEPLHAAVLIDSAGKLRWLDVSWQPFTDTQFLLDESIRLLKMPDLADTKNRQVGALK